MSLINQALKKAQRDRGPADRDGTAAGGQAGGGHTRDRGFPPGLVIGLVALIALLVGLVAGLAAVVVRGGGTDAETRTAEAAPGPDAPAPELPEAKAEPAVPPQHTPPETTSGPAGSTDGGPTPGDSARDPDAILRDLRAAREAAEAKASDQPAQRAQGGPAETSAGEDGPKQASDTAPRESKARAIEWLSEATINAVRLSADGGRALINGNAYSVGETVHYGLGLKILVIEENRILFADAQGRKYMKRH